MDKKIFVEAQIDFETIDEKIQKFLQARQDFGRAAYELNKAVGDGMFQLLIKGSPLSAEVDANETAAGITD